VHLYSALHTVSPAIFRSTRINFSPERVDRIEKDVDDICIGAGDLTKTACRKYKEEICGEQKMSDLKLDKEHNQSGDSEYINQDKNLESSARRKRKAAEARNEREEKRYQRNNKALLLTAVLIVAIMLLTRWNSDRNIIYVYAPISYEDAVDGTKDYMEILRLFADAGFTNLAKGALGDLNDSKDAQNGIVSDIMIGGKRKFTTKTRFDSTTQVVVYYHSAEEEETDEAAPESGSSAASVSEEDE
jgi:hypothetical protein